MTGFVVFANEEAREQAQQAGLAAILETVTEVAMREGRIRARPHLAQHERLVDLPAGLEALVRKEGTTPAGRVRWRVRAVEERRRGREAITTREAT